MERRDFSTKSAISASPRTTLFLAASDSSIDTSYLITGHKSPGERSYGIAPSRAARFPLVNHGKPYIIGKQRAYGVRRRGA